MNFLILAGQILIYVVLAVLLLWGAKHALSLYVFSRKKEEINKLLARISVLKMHLKGKIKRKGNKIEKIFKKEKASDTLCMIEPKLRTIADLAFSSPHDYQMLINNLGDITDALIDHIKRKHKTLINSQKNSSEINNEEVVVNEIEEKCKKLVKYDKGTMTVIVELIQATEKAISKIEEFNSLTEFDKSQKKIADIPLPIEIEHYEVICGLVEQSKKSDIGTPEMQILGRDYQDESA